MLLTVLFGFVPKSAFAHVLKVDGGIGVTLHVDPGDNPTAGETARFYFEIKDKQNKFTPEQCACAVAIAKSSNGEVVKTAQLFTGTGAGGLSTPLLEYVFMQGGVYKVSLAGSSKNGTFPNFKVTFDVRVEAGEQSKGAHTDASHGHAAHGLIELYLVIAGMIVVIVLLIIDKRKAAGKAPKVLSVVAVLFLSGGVLCYTGHINHLADIHKTHYHIAGETGHTDNPDKPVSPHVVALVQKIDFLEYIQTLQEQVIAVFTNYAPPLAVAFHGRAPPCA